MTWRAAVNWCSPPPGVRLVIIRGTDVPTYMRHGAADMGVVGKDILLEHGAEGCTSRSTWVSPAAA